MTDLTGKVPGSDPNFTGNPVNQDLAGRFDMMVANFVGRSWIGRQSNMPDIGSKILARELGRLGGFGARWVARFLPTVSFETRLEIEQSLKDTAKNVQELFANIGTCVPELDSDQHAGVFNAVIGSGRLNLNPTLVSIRLHSLGPRTALSIRAAAKEGLIKQHSAQTAVERVAAALEKPQR